MSAETQIESMIATLRKLAGRDMMRDMAAQVAPMIETAIKATAGAGTAPDGTPWAPRKDGGRPMQHAAEHIRVRSFGSIVRATLTGPDAYHNYGTGGIKRQVIPDAGGSDSLPAGIAAALMVAAGRAFDRVMGGI